MKQHRKGVRYLLSFSRIYFSALNPQYFSFAKLTKGSRVLSHDHDFIRHYKWPAIERSLVHRLGANGLKLMGKAESQQPTNLVDTVHNYSSPACWMHEVDPAYLGYWSEDEVVAFLEVLLEQERGGTKAFANIGQAADLQTSDLILESELDQVEICVLLKEEIAARRTAVVAPRQRMTSEHRTKCSLERAIAFATTNQAGLVQAIETAVPNILDAELNSHLKRMLQLHRKQIEQLKTLLA